MQHFDCYSSQYQRTALHYASEGGHHDIVRVLLEREADTSTRDWVSNLFNLVCVTTALPIIVGAASTGLT